MKRVVICILVFLGAIFASCSRESPSGTLRIGTLPTADSMPLHVALAEKLFENEGVHVDLIPFQSALERDSAFQARQIDGMSSDLVSTLLFNARGGSAKVVLLTMGAEQGVGRVAVLASPKSSIQTPADLKGVPIALSPNTVIEYITDQLLTEYGLAYQDISKMPVTKIPVRLHMLIEGQVQAATLPDPLAAFAELQGARVIIDDKLSDVGQATLTVHTTAIEGNRPAVKALIRAYGQAVDRLNANPGHYQPLLAEVTRLPNELKHIYEVVTFPKNQLPTKEQVSAVEQWLLKKGLLEQPLPYEHCVYLEAFAA